MTPDNINGLMALSLNLCAAVTGLKHFAGHKFKTGGKFGGELTSNLLRESFLPARFFARMEFFDGHIPVTRLAAD